MKFKATMRHAVAAAFAATALGATPALAVYEVEPNDALGSAQRITIGSGGSAEINGSIGTTSPATPPTGDVDFYVFEARAGDVINLDIDGGYKGAGSPTRNVDTIIALFGPGPVGATTKLAENDDSTEVDPGSINRFDSFIRNFLVQISGTYYIGVSSYPRFFEHNGRLRTEALGTSPNGSYTLTVSGVTPTVQQIGIRIKPGQEREWSPVNPKSRGNIPVAILSSDRFDAMKVEQTSLRFGANGSEMSLERCGKDGEDVNGDGRLDLVCHFDTQTAGFEPGDLEGIVKGRGPGGMFEGRGLIQVVPGKRQRD